MSNRDERNFCIFHQQIYILYYMAWCIYILRRLQKAKEETKSQTTFFTKSNGFENKISQFQGLELSF